MPGTGKPSTMVHAVKALLTRGSSILLTSCTNSAVDNSLIKLKSQDTDFVRIGRYEAVHEEVRGYCLSETGTCSVEDIRLRMDHVKVVAVTCLGITHPLLAAKRFDICIMDEAGQATLPGQPVEIEQLLHQVTDSPNTLFPKGQHLGSEQLINEITEIENTSYPHGVIDQIRQPPVVYKPCHASSPSQLKYLMSSVHQNDTLSEKACYLMNLISPNEVVVVGRWDTDDPNLVVHSVSIGEVLVEFGWMR